jgi:excisionase family DNA binding protein
MALQHAPPGPPKLALTIRGSAEATGYSENYIRLLVARKTLPAVRVGRSLRIRVTDLDDFLMRHRV